METSELKINFQLANHSASIIASLHCTKAHVVKVPWRSWIFYRSALLYLGFGDLPVCRFHSGLLVHLQALRHSVNGLQLALQLHVAVVEAARRQQRTLSAAFRVVKATGEVCILLLQVVNLKSQHWLPLHKTRTSVGAANASF